MHEVRDLLAASVTRIEAAADGVHGKLEAVREEMEGLKVELYGRFGRSINLET